MGTCASFHKCYGPFFWLTNPAQQCNNVTEKSMYCTRHVLLANMLQFLLFQVESALVGSLVSKRKRELRALTALEEGRKEGRNSLPLFLPPALLHTWRDSIRPEGAGKGIMLARGKGGGPNTAPQDSGNLLTKCQKQIFSCGLRRPVDLATEPKSFATTKSASPTERTSLLLLLVHLVQHPSLLAITTY